MSIAVNTANSEDVARVTPCPTPAAGSRIRAIARRSQVALLGASLVLAALAPMARALDLVQIRYGPIGVSASMKDIKAFAENKPVSSGFESLLGQIESYGKIPRDRLRNYLTMSVDLKALGINPADAVSLSYGFVGERLLKRVSEIIYPPYDRGNVYALRGALVTALVDDGKISALEVLEDYGPEVMRIDAAGAMGVANEIRDAIGQFLPKK